MITVRYFASAKDATGIETESFSLDSPSMSLASLNDKLNLKYGAAFQTVMHISMFAVNMEYVDKQEQATVLLKDGDEVAVIPPVSGG